MTNKGYIMIRQRKLKRLLTYIPETGEFIGGYSINVYSRGYLRMLIDKVPHSLQQLAWIYTYGKIPEGASIKFRNGNKHNVYIDNLYIDCINTLPYEKYENNNTTKHKYIECSKRVKGKGLHFKLGVYVKVDKEERTKAYSYMQIKQHQKRFIYK